MYHYVTEDCETGIINVDNEGAALNHIRTFLLNKFCETGAESRDYLVCIVDFHTKNSVVYHFDFNLDISVTQR
jgi:hypothetical protein